MSWGDVIRRMPAPPQMLPGETVSQYRAMPSAERWRRQDEEWARQVTAPFPLSWVARLLSKLRVGLVGDAAQARIALRKQAVTIGAAYTVGLTADADDADIVQEAHDSARDMTRRLLHVEGLLHAGQRERMPAVVETSAMVWGLLPPATPVPVAAHSPWSVDWAERVSLLARWADALAWLDQRGIVVRARGSIAGWLKRVQCERWWRRVLRRIHAKAVEATARGMGLVSRSAGCYISDDGLKRRTAQRARNARALESVVAVNDRGQDYTVAELAARGPANREIRRHELMTRIAGFELVAKDCGHEALFVTVTCPSRMHAQRTRRSGGVADNDKFDGTTPDQAQQYLAGQWAKFRSACERWGVELYGFRIAEPNHDGTPHWHALLFLPSVVGPGLVRANARAGRPVAGRVAVRLLRRYFWRDAGTAKDQAEQGARRHRVAVERIDWSRGSAAGYVAKYVSKNIDGYRVDKDLYGNEALTSSRRVDAWAATWRIRQFQQIGGAPVTIWRELRRLHPEQASVTPTIAMSLDAVNVGADVERAARDDENLGIKSDKTAAHGWATYLALQGGHRVRRADLRVRILTEQTGELGRYGDPVGPRPVGVITTEVTRETLQPIGIVLRPIVRTVAVTHAVESERSTWVTVARECVQHVRVRMREGVGLARTARPWSPVNNCTRPAGWADTSPQPLFAPVVRRARKLGRWHNWQRRELHEPPKPGAE